MRAVVFDKQLKCVDDYPEPVPVPGEALIRVQLAGICGTDLEITKGYSNFRGIPGHEFVGVVDSTAGGGEDLTGKRVVGEINAVCGHCVFCTGGLRNHCPSRKVLGIVGKNGAFAEYITLPVENIHVVPDAVSDEEAVFTEPLAAAFRIPEQIGTGGEESVLVMGDGKLGLLTAFVLQDKNRNLVLTGKHAEKLGIAASSGIKTMLLDEMKKEPFFDMVVDATGSADGLTQALAFVRPGGNIIMKTTVADPVRVDFSRVVVNEVTITGSRCGPFRPALDFLARKEFDLTPLIAGLFPVSRFDEAFAAARMPGALKVIIDFRAG